MSTKRKFKGTTTNDLKQALQAYVAARPWAALRDHHVLKLEHPADGTTMYAIAMGDGDQEFGVSVHLGPDAASDIAGELAGQARILSPRLAIMTEFHPDGPNQDALGMIHHRVEPAPSMAAASMAMMLKPQSKLSQHDSQALLHALQAAIDLARAAKKPGSPVRHREDGTQFHLITSRLENGIWSHTMEVMALGADD